MDFAAALLEQNRAFGDLVDAGDPATPIPACPEWSLKQLFRHVGRGHRWAAQLVAERHDEPLDPRAVEAGKPPEDPAEAIGWLHEGAQRVVDAVAAVGADTPVWTFIGPRPARWWIRRRLHEVVVHRFDAAQALGLAYRPAPELAADALSEWLDLAVALAGRPDATQPLGAGHSVHLHATEPGLGAAGEWMISAGPGGVDWSREHGKGSVALRGAASELLLAALGRIPLADTGITVFGDTRVWRNWVDRTPF